MNRLIFLAAAFVMLLSSCSTTRYPNERRDYPDDRRDYPFPRSERDKDEEKDRDKDEGRGREGRTYPFSALGIPKGHLPPPGECKIWIPGRPPGQQGPPQSCSSALRNAPLGAWVITHEGNRYRVNIFNRSRRNVIDEVRYYVLGE
ncbi:MAG: hypothetical protein M3342_05835 [Bacteroidota bacterium]|nr:hypothetical protein [Bacteroidota bacterium]